MEENSPNLGNQMPMKGERHTDVQTVLEKNIQPIHNIIKTKYTEQRKDIEATKEKVILYIKKCL